MDGPFEVDVIAGTSMFVKRTIYELTGLFNEEFFMYYEDGEFCYRVKKRGYKRIYLPTVVIKHIHMASAKKNLNNFSIMVSSFKSACIYFENVKNPLYAYVFKIISNLAWSLEFWH